MKPYLKYALITSSVIIIWTLVQYIAGLDRSDTGQYLSWVSYPIMFLFILMAMREQKALNGGYIAFDEAFKTGMFMMVVAAVIMSVFTYIYFTFINPDFLDFVAEKTRTQMEEKDMSDEEIEQAMKYAGMFMSTGFMTAMALIGNAIIGAIFSLICAATVKKKKPVEAG